MQLGRTRLPLRLTCLRGRAGGLGGSADRPTCMAEACMANAGSNALVTKTARSLWWFQKAALEEHKPACALERGMKINKPGLARGRRGLDCVCKSPASFLMQRCHGLPWLWPAGLEALKSNKLLKHTLFPTPRWPWLQIKFQRDLRHQECHQKKRSWPGFFFFAPQH